MQIVNHKITYYIYDLLLFQHNKILLIYVHLVIVLQFFLPLVQNSLLHMSDKELQQKLTIETNPQTQLRILIELNTRQARQITALTNRIAILEDKALKKAGRKRVPIYLDGRELTDDDILYYIDEDYYTIVELERVTKAPKNLIRNRYNRAKKKQRIAKE